MNFRQDEEHKEILEMVHDFAVNEVKPLAAEIDQTEEFPTKNVEMMAEMGLLGIPFPEEYGGSGLDTLAYIQTVEELSKYEEDNQEHFVLGGAMIYKLLLPKCNRLYITEIDKEFEGDTFFPEIKQDEWKIVKKETGPQDDNTFKYYYIDYERIR